MRRTFLTISLSALAMFLYGCAGIELPPVPSTVAPQPATTNSVSLAKTGGKSVLLEIQIPADNPQARRFPAVYISKYVLGYMAAWNDKVFSRAMFYRANNGVFANPAAQANSQLYEGERFDVQGYVQKLQANPTPTKSSDTTGSDLWSRADELAASSAGSGDGKSAAIRDFARLMLPQEQR